ncbi:acyl carrier protein [Planctomycetota bacterium]
MGLDIVELILDVEETFGIHIPDEEVTNMLSIQSMINYIAEHVPTISRQECQAQQIFYRLRRGFCKQIPELTDDLRLQTKIKDVLHKDQWPKVWTAIKEQVGEDYWPEAIPWLGILLKREPTTVRELAYYVAFNLPKPNVELNEPWTKERIALQVRDIVKDYAGNASFRHSDEFYRDLRIG